MKTLNNYINEAKNIILYPSRNRSLKYVLDELADAHEFYKEKKYDYTDAHNAYCSYLSMYNWGRINEKHFIKVDADSPDWEETIDNIIYVRKNKDKQFAFFENKNTHNFDFCFFNQLYGLSFDMNNRFGSAYYNGCYIIYKTYPAPYTEPSVYTNKELKKLLKDYNIYVHTGKPLKIAKPNRSLEFWESPDDFE